MVKLGIHQLAVRGRLEAIEKDTGIKLILSWKRMLTTLRPTTPKQVTQTKGARRRTLTARTSANMEVMHDGSDASTSEFGPKGTQRERDNDHWARRREGGFETLRQEARKRRIISSVKPFTGTLRVTNPVRQSRASSRKWVLRG